jgi:hypothetical protein
MINYKKIEKKLKKVLDQESDESLKAWLDKKRAEEKNADWKQSFKSIAISILDKEFFLDTNFYFTGNIYDKIEYNQLVNPMDNIWNIEKFHNLGHFSCIKTLDLTLNKLPFTIQIEVKGRTAYSPDISEKFRLAKAA